MRLPAPVLIVVIFACLAASVFPQQQTRPNILFLFADDFSYEALGAAGNTEVHTPNLDKLAKRGTCFSHAYNMGSWSPAVCIASRTMLMTGRSVWRAERLQKELENERAAGRFWPELMRQAGYTTYMTGKWHVSTKPEKSFDHILNVRAGMPKDGSQAYHRPYDELPDEWNAADPSLGGYWSEKDSKHWSEITADDVLHFLNIAKTDTNPFFMYVAFNAPHDPRQSPQSYLDQYAVEKIKLPENYLPEYPYMESMGAGKELRDERLAPFPRTPHAIKTHRREYYAIITHLDAQIGRVLEALEQSGQAANTVIFFTADNGLSVGHHGLLGKQNQYDTSLRVPFLMAGPGVPNGQTIHTPIMLQDAMPTVLELANTTLPEYVEFHSLLPYLKTPTNGGAYDAVYGAYLDLQRSVNDQGHKLILYPRTGKARLFDLSSDPHEMHDLADREASQPIMRKLFMRLLALQKDYDDALDLKPVFPSLVTEQDF